MSYSDNYYAVYNRERRESMTDEEYYEWRASETKKAQLNRAKKKDKLIEMYGGKCSDCGGVFNRAAYDFHHLNPKEKEYNISRIMQWSFDRIVEELIDCILLCSNCHRIRHAIEHESFE